jgi:hypothetical protein
MESATALFNLTTSWRNKVKRYLLQLDHSSAKLLEKEMRLVSPGIIFLILSILILVILVLYDGNSFTCVFFFFLLIILCLFVVKGNITLPAGVKTSD